MLYCCAIHCNAAHTCSCSVTCYGLETRTSCGALIVRKYLSHNSFMSNNCYRSWKSKSFQGICPGHSWIAVAGRKEKGQCLGLCTEEPIQWPANQMYTYWDVKQIQSCWGGPGQALGDPRWAISDPFPWRAHWYWYLQPFNFHSPLFTIRSSQHLYTCWASKFLLLLKNHKFWRIPWFALWSCYPSDVFHVACLDQYACNLPANTAPAGYTCPKCKVGELRCLEFKVSFINFDTRSKM